MLRYLAARGIAPGDAFEVVDKQPFGGPIFARFGAATTSTPLGGALAARDAGRARVNAAARRRGAPRPTPPLPAADAAAARRARRGRVARRAARCSAPRSSPASPTSTRATSPRTSPAAPSTATCCCGCSSRANLMAMLIQNLSAKIGIATGKNLPELCREHFPRPVTWGLWVQAELIAMATDLAEFVGAAIALNLLFGVPLFAAGPDHRGRRVRDPRAADAAATAASSWRSSASSAIILLGFLYDTLRIGFDAGDGRQGLRPALRRHRQRPARHRHPRRDGDAARHLPALGADPEPRSRRATTPSAARCCASTAST